MVTLLDFQIPVLSTFVPSFILKTMFHKEPIGQKIFVSNSDMVTLLGFQFPVLSTFVHVSNFKPFVF